MKKALVLVACLGLLFAAFAYGAHYLSRNSAMQVRHEYDYALSVIQATHMRTFSRILQESDDADAATEKRYRGELAEAKIAHDEAVAKVANLNEDDAARIASERAADDQQHAADAIALQTYLAAKAHNEENFQREKKKNEEEEASALSELDARYDASVRN